MRGLVLDFGGVLDRADSAVLAAYVTELRACRVRVAVLSNDPGGSGAQDLRGPGGDLADVVVRSGDVGLRKPDDRIYRYVAAELGLPPGQCVMVDDHAAYVRGAARAGMVGVHHVGAVTTVAELRILFGSGAHRAAARTRRQGATETA